MKTVLVPTKLDPVAQSLLEAHGGYRVVQDTSSDLARLAKEHADTYALIVRSERVTPEIIDALPSLKVIIRAGAGYNTIDTKHARSKGIDVMNTPGANANAVAEEVVALMLADARHIIEGDTTTRAGQWEKKRLMGREITGKTVGVVGLGYIGKLVVRRLSGFNVTVVGYDPMLSAELANDLDIQLVDLPTLFERSDYVTLHIPETAETRGLINADLLGRMKPGGTLINCARAGVVNEDDLRAAKAEKSLRFLNDVYPEDKAGEKSVADIADIMMPHTGASTAEANYNAARRAAEQLIELDEKGITSFIVNRDIPPGLDEAYCELAFVLSKFCRSMIGRSAKLKLIETSFYGDLKPYAKWLVVPIVAALSEDFDRSSDHNVALEFLRKMGIDYCDRETDERKRFKSSITVDFIGNAGEGQLVRASVRGTVAEATLMISRINDFDKLYFEPAGGAVLFTYMDRPGVIGRIGAMLADAGINIDDVRNPHDPSGTTSLALMKIGQPASDELVEKIAREIEASAFCYVQM
jgi:D-3-phosphoglycerate dehydrogenase